MRGNSSRCLRSMESLRKHSSLFTLDVVVKINTGPGSASKFPRRPSRCSRVASWRQAASRPSRRACSRFHKRSLRARRAAPTSRRISTVHSIYSVFSSSSLTTYLSY
jgi:hypothetical protein